MSVISFIKENHVKFMLDQNVKFFIAYNAPIIVLVYVIIVKKVIIYLIHNAEKDVPLAISNTMIVVKNVYIHVKIVKIKNNA